MGGKSLQDILPCRGRKKNQSMRKRGKTIMSLYQSKAGGQWGPSDSREADLLCDLTKRGEEGRFI